jgi:hypothetical protein
MDYSMLDEEKARMMLDGRISIIGPHQFTTGVFQGIVFELLEKIDTLRKENGELIESVMMQSNNVANVEKE